MYKFLGALCVLTSLAGCVKLQILPEDTVQNSIDAGKNLYTEYKLEKSGGEKREFSKQLVIADFDSTTEAETACLSELKLNVTKQSVKKAPEFLSEKLVVVPESNGSILECRIEAYVWVKS